jgi:hypothetical protein
MAKEQEPPSYEDRIHGEVTLTLAGGTLEEILFKAKLEACTPLNAPLDRIYIVSHTTLRVADTARFEEPRPTLWSCTVTCGTIPE